MVIGSGEAQCKSCGYEYKPGQGDPDFPIAKGTLFQVRIARLVPPSQMPLPRSIIANSTLRLLGHMRGLTSAGQHAGQHSSCTHLQLQPCDLGPAPDSHSGTLAALSAAPIHMQHS
jgi:hypothetical protein